MKLIFCIDNRRGMMFNSRRQSQDRELRRRMLELIGGARLWMSPYSAKQFEGDDSIIADSDFMDLAGEGDYCFVEDSNFTLDDVDEVVLYLWNRDYPADRYFDIDLAALGFEQVESHDFKGYSHEKITEKIYKRTKR